MLLECRKANALWQHFSENFYELDKVRILINKENFIMGIIATEEVIKHWNWFAMQIKYYIYKCRLNGNQPRIQVCEAIIQGQLKVKRYNAAQGQERTHFNRWWRKWIVEY